MPNAAGAIAHALQQLGKPYLWGATGPGSYDCSGLIVDSYKTAIGVTLPRTTQAMLADKKLRPVTRQQLAPGDLVFPSTEHVQLYLGGGMVVEAPHTGATVRLARLGTFMTGRRVTEPASGDWSTAGPVRASEGVTPGQTLASITSQGLGQGLPNFLGPAISAIVSWVWWFFELSMGSLSILFGLVVVMKSVKGSM